MRLSECVAVTRGQLFHGDCEFTAVSTDTRSLVRGNLFVALRGERFDAHRFLGDALAAGAAGMVVQAVDDSIAVAQLQVRDTTVALGDIARLHRSHFRGQLIALTGSSGKTTVKGMLAAILSRAGAVTATRGNFNNHIGVPLTLLRIAPDDAFAVIEMGTNHPGEIAYLAGLAQSDVALVNNVMAAHLEGFGSLAGIAAEKAAIYGGLRPGGTAVINLDDPFAGDFLAATEGANRIGFTVEGPRAAVAGVDVAMVVARDVRTDAQGCCAFQWIADGVSEPVTLRVPGRHNVANALAAGACALAVGVSGRDIAAGLSSFTAEPGRMQMREAFNGALLIDDTYNANPGSVRAAIDYLVQRGGDTVLVLGELGELGVGAENEHAELGRYACEKGVARLFCCGAMTSHTARAFGKNARVFTDRETLIDALRETLLDASTVLVKGSRSARMEHVVAALAKNNNTTDSEAPTQC